MGVYDLKSKPSGGENNNSLKNKFHGGSPLSLKENHRTQAAFLQNKNYLKQMFKKKEDSSETSSLLNENLIRPDSEI